MMILSMDLGKFNTVCCLYDTQKREYRFETVATKRSHVDHLLQSHRADLVVMEACGPSGWISDTCRARGMKTIVCSTNDEAWCWKNTKRKTDRDDALKLAKMAMMDALTPVHVPAPEIRQQRMLVKYRKKLDGRINRIKNAIRALFVGQGIEIDTGKRAWCLGRERIDSFRKPLDQCSDLELWQGELDLELTQLDDLTRQMDFVEKKLETYAKKNPHVQRVMTIPGVGRKTAEALVASIDDPHRFKSARHLSSYLGMTPKQYQSGETDRSGRISKRGPRMLRSLLLECAWASTRYNAWSKLTFARIHGGSRTRRKKAGIALARKLAVIAWAMMRDETDWDSSKLLPEVPPEDVKLKVKRPQVRPAGELHSGQPVRPSVKASRSRKRRGTTNRHRVKT
ncbi:Transposase IS116/IS110/IS902 family protein [Rubripirellula amarantea]|uniref:Transposase IS116/IS110/IS902 family protein n=1 Tax=Rubripirellula amarantea TaxID=2527999 RepID=A0A5C5WCU6_9BACT|nr:IS110 family transposase [Rubripirellula amarantea]TWT47859.1 Transposase IS116/IS110/IS902 family protein [Rubripirellula amarantea]